MSVTRPRRIALEVISRLKERDAYAHETLDAVLSKEQDLSQPDRGFVTVLSYGVIQTYGTLKYIISRSITPGTILTPQVEAALCISTYELVFLKKPDHVVVSQGVDLVKSVTRPAGGLANAVLRKIVRDTKRFPWGDPEKDIAALAHSCGHPVWLAQRFVDELGFERAKTMMEANNLPAPLYVATNVFRANDEDVRTSLANDKASPVPITQGASTDDLLGCTMCENARSATRGSAITKGEVFVCDASAQEIAQLASPKPRSSFLEIGAGRGTKTALFQGFAQRAGSPAKLYAIDLHPYKVDILKTRMKDMGVPNVIAQAIDATDMADDTHALPQEFESVYIDAPCSGLGTLRRHPEKRWRVTPEDITVLADLNLKLIKEASRRVAQEGSLIYSTCTLTHEENGQVVERFLESEEGRGFAVDTKAFSTRADTNAGIMGEGYFQTLPSVGGPDGHFAVRLIRTSR